MFERNKTISKGSAHGDSVNSLKDKLGEQSLIGAEAMIGPGVTIEGKIVSEEDLVIEGRVKGSISAKNNQIVVGASGQLTADLCANRVKIEGTVKGDITGGEKVILTHTGNVVGNIEAPRVSLEEGAKFKGSIEMDPGDQRVADISVASSMKSSSQTVAGDSQQVDPKAS